MKIELNECKVCHYHICVMKTSIYCGYDIDRKEKSILYQNDIAYVDKCPKLM